MNKPSILIIFMHKYRWGVQIRGDERGLFEKAKRFRKSGLGVFTLERQPSFQEDVGEKVYTSIKVKSANIPPSSFMELANLVIGSIIAVVKNNRLRLRPIAIYAYNQDIENVFVGYVLKILMGSRLVVVYHQISPQFVTSFWDSFFSRRAIGSRLKSSFFRSLLPAINRFALKHADLNIAISEAAKQDVIDYLGLTRCTVTGNGLDSQRFRPLDVPKTYDAVFFGRLAPQKGIDVLLKAWRKVVDERRGSKLVLIGGGEDKDVQEYKDMIRELQLEKNTILKGFIDDDDVINLLSSSKLYVFPSRKEGFAQTVSQAMACGMCCIVSDIPPLRENYRTGAIFVPVDNPKALADVIINLLSDERKREEYSSHAREYVIDFKWENVVNRELSAINQIL